MSKEIGMMSSGMTIRRRAVVNEDGAVLLDELPFAVGEEVEITLRTASLAEQGAAAQQMLKGSVLHYEDPTEPVADGGQIRCAATELPREEKAL